jgi:hypothetical protein
MSPSHAHASKHTSFVHGGGGDHRSGDVVEVYGPGTVAPDFMAQGLCFLRCARGKGTGAESWKETILSSRDYFTNALPKIKVLLVLTGELSIPCLNFLKQPRLSPTTALQGKCCWAEVAAACLSEGWEVAIPGHQEVVGNQRLRVLRSCDQVDGVDRGSPL